jgi:hypothetical protein
VDETVRELVDEKNKDGFKNIYLKHTQDKCVKI